MRPNRKYRGQKYHFDGALGNKMIVRNVLANSVDGRRGDVLNERLPIRREGGCFQSRRMRGQLALGERRTDQNQIAVELDMRGLPHPATGIMQPQCRYKQISYPRRGPASAGVQALLSNLAMSHTARLSKLKPLARK
jgi:hypothetical protein